MKAKKLLCSASLLAAVCLTSGCESMSNTAKGGLIGGGVGAGLGAAAGSASGHAGKGALIGGVAGTLLGGLVGNDVDHQEKKQKEAELAVAQARPTTPPLGMTDIVQMTKEGVSENVIINQIRNSNSTYQLSNEDIRFLSANNVSPNVIGEMQNRRPVARVVQQQPQVIYQPAPPPVVYVESYPPPGPVIYGATYIRR